MPSVHGPWWEDQLEEEGKEEIVKKNGSVCACVQCLYIYIAVCTLEEVTNLEQSELISQLADLINLKKLVQLQ